MAQSTTPRENLVVGTTGAVKGTGVFFPPGVYFDARTNPPAARPSSNSSFNRSRRGSLQITRPHNSANSHRHSFGSCPSFPPAPASTAGSTASTPTPPRSPLMAGKQTSGPSPFAVSAAQSRGCDAPACPLLEGRAAFNTAGPLLPFASTAGPAPQASPECFGLAVSAGAVSGQGYGAGSLPSFGFSVGGGSSSTSTTMPLQAYACSSSMLAPGLMTSRLSAALCVPQSEQPGQLDATDSLSNTLLQLQLQLQLQQATSAVAAAAPLPMGPTPDGGMYTSTGLGEQGWASHCSTYGTGLVSGLAAYPAMGPTQVHFASPQEDLLQVQMPLTATCLGSASPAAVLAMPATAPALAAAAAGSSDDDNISSMDDLTAALDAQLLLLIAKREELLAKRVVSAAFSAGLLM